MLGHDSSERFFVWTNERSYWHTNVYERSFSSFVGERTISDAPPHYCEWVKTSQTSLLGVLVDRCIKFIFETDVNSSDFESSISEAKIHYEYISRRFMQFVFFLLLFYLGISGTHSLNEILFCELNFLLLVFISI